ncbi:MAG: large conductance mechanosensitive channel protein MscL, partial [Clostridia bacterium]|nr:large conductance mechanosensitive channel protein MscL [Clostridia bacterium]
MAEKKKSGFWKDFKDFISKGNVIDLAVAVVIGAAFNKIVSSFVNDIIMPLISLAVGGKSVADWKWIITEQVVAADGTVTTAENALRYGAFIQNVIDF